MKKIPKKLYFMAFLTENNEMNSSLITKWLNDSSGNGVPPKSIHQIVGKMGVPVAKDNKPPKDLLFSNNLTVWIYVKELRKM